MTSEEKREILQAFRTLVETVGLADARDWLRSESRDLDWALMELINRKTDTTPVEMSVFKASAELFVDASKMLEDA